MKWQILFSGKKKKKKKYFKVSSAENISQSAKHLWEWRHLETLSGGDNPCQNIFVSLLKRGLL